MTKRRQTYDAMDAMLGDVGRDDPPASTPVAHEPTDELPTGYVWRYDARLERWIPRKRRKDYVGASVDHESRNARYGRATTYRLPAELADEVAETARRDKHHMSDFAAAIIRAGLDAYQRGDVKVR